MNYSTHVPVMEKPPTNYRLPSAPDESPCPPTLVEPDELDRHSTTSADDVRVHLMAGAAAGIMEHCVMYPVDSVKTRMQSLRPEANAVYKNITDAFQKITKSEGLFRPMRGINIVMLGSGPAHACYFTTYEIMKKMLGNNGNGGHFPLANAAAGAVATVVHDGTMNPIEAIKQRMQMYGSPYKGVTDCAMTMYRTEGLRAFYRSYTTQLTMNIPFQCLHFMTYEFVKEVLHPGGGYDPKSHLLAGACAGALAAAVTTPLDVAKTLLNTQEKKAVCELALAGSTNFNRHYVSGMFMAMRTIYDLRGFAGYFQGIRARIIYQMPSCAICWSVYEFFKYSLSMQISDEELADLTSG